MPIINSIWIPAWDGSMNRLGWKIQWFAAASLKSPAPKRWMDAYLCACARLASAQLVTFDSGFRQYESDGLVLSLLAGKEK